MRITELVTPASIAVRVHIDDKPDALRFAAMALGSRSGLDPEKIRVALAAREELGSTGIGSGIAVPHVCIPHLGQSHALLCTLARPIAFDAIDSRPVDLVCALISPTYSKPGVSESLSNLAAISRILRDKETASAIRKAASPWDIYNIIVRAVEKAAQLTN